MLMHEKTCLSPILYLTDFTCRQTIAKSPAISKHLKTFSSFSAALNLLVVVVVNFSILKPETQILIHPNSVVC